MSSIRTTALRRAIIETLNEVDRPLSVPELKNLLAGRDLAPHKTSLYRSLDKMVEEGSVQQVLLDNATAYYERDGVHHHHAYCGICARVLCVAHEAAERGVAELESVAKAAGFYPDEHHIVLRGTCDTCQS